MHIRTGTDTDVDAAAEIWQAAHHARLGFAPDGARKDRAMAVLVARLALPDARFLIAERDGSAIGMLLACQARENDGAGLQMPGLLHISYVATHPDYWGRGVASQLLADIASKARAMHNDALQLWVVTNNARARALYERCGFAFTGREKIDDYGEPIVHYRMELRGSP